MERNLEYDLDFFYNQPRIEIYFKLLSNPSNQTYIINQIKNFSKKHKKFYVTTVYEKIQDELFLEKINLLIDDLNSKGSEIYLCMTTSTFHRNCLHPLISILHYRDFGKVSDSADNFDFRKRIILADYKLFDKPKLKQYKSILSLRRKTYERDIFINTFHKKLDGIFRYISSDKNAKDKFPTYTELIDEYKKTYISIVFETATFTYLNSFTEKIFIAFATKTLPILYLKNGRHLDEFKSMGFFLLNDYFDYSDVCETMSESEKASKLIKVIDSVNDLTLKDVEKIYAQYSIELENNFKIIADIITNNFNYNQSILKLNKIVI